MGAMLSGLQAKPENEMTSEYLKLEISEEVRCWFLGMAKIKKIDGEDGETSDAVRLLQEDGSYAINADAVIVSTCRQFIKTDDNGKDITAPTPICIQCTGEKGPVEEGIKPSK